MGNGEYSSAVTHFTHNPMLIHVFVGEFQIGFVAADMTDPVHDLPRVINTAMGVALGGFILMNISLFTVLPFDQMREKSFVAVVCSLRCPCNLFDHTRIIPNVSPRTSAFNYSDSRAV